MNVYELSISSFFNRALRLVTALAITMPLSAHAESSKRLGALVYCSEASPAGFDPGQQIGDVEYTAGAETVYNRLVEFKRGGTRLEPGLATDWHISSNGRVYTFHLRRGVKFHTTPWFKPTRAFNAEDVLFTFERMRNPNMPFRKAYPSLFPYWDFADFDKIIEKIEASGPYTVRFTLKTVDAPFLTKLAEPALSILSAEYAAQLLEAGKPSEINWKPVGTGPFIFQKYLKDAAIYFEGNPEYWKPEDVQLSHLVFTITPNATVRAQKLKANKCQVIVYPRLADIPALQADPDLRVLSQPVGFTLSWLAYNTSHKPLDDVRVRRALDMAIDKDAIIKAVYEGHAQVAVGLVPPLEWPYDKNLKDEPRSLKQAKALLTQAGYPNGFSISLWASIARPYNPNPKLMAELIQADWEKIGVKADVQLLDWGEYLRRGMNGEHDTLFLGNISGKGEPNSWFRQLSCEVHSINFSKWCYSPFEALIQQAVHTLDIGQRTRLYLEAQRIFKREQPSTSITYPVIYQAINKNVTNFKIHPIGITVFHGVGLK